MSFQSNSSRPWLLALTLSLFLVVVIAWLSPLERTLGGNLRLVYLHGAWVWTGMLAFGAASLAGLLALIFHRPWQHALSSSLGLSGMAFWLTYLPMSLLVMQLNWNGLYLDEPRWKVPFAFAVIGLLLQAGLWLIANRTLTSAANLIFGLVLLYNISRMESVLHPDSPVFSSSSGSIRGHFILLVVVTSLLCGVITAWQMQVIKRKESGC